MITMSRVKLQWIITIVFGIALAAVCVYQLWGNVPLTYVLPAICIFFVYACAFPEKDTEQARASGGVLFVLFVLGLIAEYLLLGWLLPVVFSSYFVAQFFNVVRANEDAKSKTV